MTRGTGKKSPASPSASTDLATRLRAIVDAAILAMERKVMQLYGTLPDDQKGVVLNDEDLARLLALGDKAAVWIGHVRRSDDAIRQAMKKLSRPAVVGWLRELDEAERDRIIADATGDDIEGSPFR